MKKKGLIIRGTVVAVLIAGVMITGCKKDDTKKVNVGKASPEKTIETYCNSLVEKKYADILDLAYFPKSDYITSEKIKDSKSGFIDKMVEENEGVKDCTYDKIDETKDIISYKLIITTDNGDETRDIEVRKKDGKIVLDDLYAERYIKVFKDSKVSIDGKKVTGKTESKEDDGNQVEIYTITVLPDAEYDITVTHPVFDDEEVVLSEESLDYVKYPIWQDQKMGFDDNMIDLTAITQDYFKKEYKEELNTDICEGCVEIVKTVLEDGDINTLNKYFLNNNAEEFVSSNPDLNGTNRVGLKEEYDIEFKQILDSSINQIKYIDKNQLKLSVVVSYQCNMSYKNKDAIVLGGSRDSVRGDHMTLDLYCTKDGDVWKISSWD
ncbi:hypothetical protein [Coprococcus comes]|uniref:hypothetical protein n=1 Tax=Coprococcus comes TaxID=410072 RepID=UPI000821F65F|nr:hypothetical protein [Coprococcus comes]MDB1814430.1 hypothetical protein [Coprococcus comes]MDB1817482.1 hypothetical protein [Coprococcus comes]MDC0787190.1 hypothetical protein [Coprococcus comes]MDC0787741.1 hypothetical protein [Coprococcus comes]MDC0791194.1 hypothetical protein [Coprococcus comes]